MTTKPLLFLSVLLGLLFSNCQEPQHGGSTEKEAEDIPYLKEENIKWASPDGFDLTMDIYTPQTGKESYPVIVMYHGGGWLINDETIMDQSAAYLATNGEYVVCNVNYRLLVDQDNTVNMNQIVEDAFGAVLWVKANISKYKGNPKRVIVTGDSAGGHLAMMITGQGKQLSSTGFEGIPLGFNPSWLPEGKTAEDIAAEDGLAVQAAIISYGAFDINNIALDGFETDDNGFWGLKQAKARGMFGEGRNLENSSDRYRAVSPIFNIPDATTQALPPILFTVGEKDNATTPESIEAYITKLKEAGHANLEYWVHEGRPHAFLDSGSNEFLQINFEDDAPPALDKMLAFLDEVFY